MNHLVERHGFRLDPRADGHYVYESVVDGEPCFLLATRRKLKRRDDPGRSAADEALILVTRRWAILSRPPYVRNLGASD